MTSGSRAAICSKSSVCHGRAGRRGRSAPPARRSISSMKSFGPVATTGSTSSTISTRGAGSPATDRSTAARPRVDGRRDLRAPRAACPVRSPDADDHRVDLPPATRPAGKPRRDPERRELLGQPRRRGPGAADDQVGRELDDGLEVRRRSRRRPSGSFAASGGQSQKRDRPTTRSPAPTAKSASVVAGDTDTMRCASPEAAIGACPREHPPSEAAQRTRARAPPRPRSVHRPMSPYLCSFSMSAGRETPSRRAVSLWLRPADFERLGDEGSLERLDPPAKRVARARDRPTPSSASPTATRRPTAIARAPA